MCLEKNETIEIPETTNPKDMVSRLAVLLGTVKLVRLVELLEDVIEETGYGDVKIVVAEGKVQMLKAEHSYK
jgi:hypothetical protein